MKAFLIDLDRCNGCYCCQLACKDEHCGNDWSPIAKPQPMIGQFWCRVDEEERGRVPVVRVAYTPSFCGNCDECPLLEAAPECVSRNEYGFVVIDPDAARGRSDLADLCPHGFVFWNDDLAISQKCTGCAHLLQNGWNEPRCVDACSTGALRFIDEDGDADEIARASHAPGSHVYYLNVPKRWIAGTIVDRSINEVIIGADVTISDEQGNEVARVQTDWCGDFRYYECDRARYRVQIHAQGYEPVELFADCTEADVVFDDVLVVRKA